MFSFSYFILLREEYGTI